MSSTTLDLKKTIETIERLSLRISDRFPDSSLHRVCINLKKTAEEAEVHIIAINKPYYLFRTIFIILCLLTVLLLYSGLLHLHLNFAIKDISDLTQSAEATLNGIALLGAAFFFLYKLEDYFKRKIILKVFHELRTIAHVIDMHQLTKDPKAINIDSTTNSPIRKLSPFELYRYLDYCSEMLSLTSKVAVFYANENRDQAIVTSINEIEILTSTLSRKIWQKISLIKTIENGI
jgi:hypothetical protein